MADPAVASKPGNALAIVLVVLLAFLGATLGTRFLNLGLLQGIAFQLPELGMLALAMMLPLVSGGINLAVVATANLSGLTMAFVLHALAPSPFAIPVALAAGALVGCAVGAVNGGLIALVGISPIVATLGTMTFVEGLGIGLTHGGVISEFPAPLLLIGQGTLAGVPLDLILFGLTAAAVALVLQRTPFGRHIYLIGSNAEATRFSGVDIRHVRLGVYVLSGAICWLGGLIMMARFNSANASYGQSYLLVSILVAVLGGIHPDGGSGRVGGLLLALVLLQVISTALNLLGFSNFLTMTVWGAALIVVVLLPRLRHVIAARLSPRPGAGAGPV